MQHCRDWKLFLNTGRKRMEIFTSYGKGAFISFIVNVKDDTYVCAHMPRKTENLAKTGDYSELLPRLIHASAYESDCEQLFEKLSLEYLRKFRDGLNENNDSGSFYMDYQVKDLSIKRWGRVSVYAVDNDEFNSAEHVMILFQDITEQKEKEIEYQQTLREAYEIAERANQAKTTFLNNMSHDIRTPMNAIIGFTSLAATHLEDPERLKGYLSKIMVSSNHLLSLINDVLDMSRIESGKVKIEENECSIPIVMHDLRNILQSDIKAKRLDFFIDTVDVVNEDVICDKLRLNQVLLNCMSNAMKYTRPGGTVGIRIIQKENSPEGFADYDFVVRDTGIGMSEEFTAHIFEPFTREENSTISRIPGTGLGMAITKNIVDMMGGSIRVKSKIGEGTEFTISLRLKIASRCKERGVIRELNGFRALVADDSIDSCVSVEKMLRTIGLRPEWTTSGKEAVFRAKYATQQNDPFQVYIIDWLMPDMNGIEVVRRIRSEIGEQVPIIILTAYDWSDIEEEAREAGVTAFCAKPLFLSELYDVLQSASQAQSAMKVPTFYKEEFDGKKILLVEDVELNREIAETILTEAGFQVYSVENGRQAVEYMATAEPDFVDVVLMDVQMPEMDGYEATRRIRRLENQEIASKPIIAMTANAFEEDVQEALKAGMNDHMAKPIRIETLYALMRKYL